MKIFFIPGLLCTNAIWGELNTLRQQYDCDDVDVINFDEIEKMSSAMLDKISTQGNIALIGLSMGGYVAIDAALKLGKKLKKLILINTTAYPVCQKTIKDRHKAIQSAKVENLKEILIMSKGICYYQAQKEWIQLEERMAEIIGSKAYIRQQQAIINRKDYSHLIKNITAETLIIAGKNDRVIPYQDSIFMAQQINYSHLVLLNKCGHLSTLEKSSFVAGFVEKFLEQK